MPQIDILIQGRSYSLQCAEGEEKRAHSLAAHINRHAGRLTARLGAMPDAQLLLMVSMMIADELLEAREHIGRLQEEGGEARPLLTSAEEEAELGASMGIRPSLSEKAEQNPTDLGGGMAEEAMEKEEDVREADASEADIAEAAAPESSAARTASSAARTASSATRTADIVSEEEVADSDTSQAIAEAVATEEAEGFEEEAEEEMEESTAEQAEHDRELAERIEASSRRLERIADLLEAEQAGTPAEALAEDPEGGGAEDESENGRFDFSAEASEEAGGDDAEPEEPPPSAPVRRGFRPD